VFVPGRKKPWRLSIPPKFSPNGKRRQLFFLTKDEALQEAKECRGHHGELLKGLSPHDLSEAVRALELLRPHDIGILEAATSFLASLERRSASMTFGQVIEAYSGSTASRSRSHADQTRVLVEHLEAVLVCDLTAADIERAFKSCSASTHDKRISIIKAVLNYAVRKTWALTNVATRIDRRAAPSRDEVKTYSVDEARALLNYCLEHDQQILPYYALAFFCGLRPERECAQLNWSDIHLDGTPEVVVGSELSKVRQRRVVPVSANCVQWFRAAGVPMVGRVCPFSDSAIARRRGAMCKAVGVTWLKDGPRHTFCSAWLAKHKNVDRLREISGHTDTRTLFKHYNRTMRETDADQFWTLVP
jgi:integrase